jgi:hypothetical protein
MFHMTPPFLSEGGLWGDRQCGKGAFFEQKWMILDHLANVLPYCLCLASGPVGQSCIVLSVSGVCKGKWWVRWLKL